jgi:MFS family permease
MSERTTIAAKVREDREGRVALAAWWMLFVITLLFVLSFIDRLMITMLVNPIKADLGLTDVQMGIILGPAFAVSYAVFAVPMGWAADRISARWALFAGAVCWSISAAGLGVVHSFLPILICRTGVGVGEASLTPSAYSLMGDKFPPRRLTLAMSIFNAGAPLGTAIAFILGGLIIGFANSIGTISGPLGLLLKPWQLTLVATGLPCAFIALLAFTFGEQSGRKKIQNRDPADPHIWNFLLTRRKLFVPMMIGSSLVMLVAYALLAWVPTYMTRRFGWEAPAYGPILGTISLLTALATVAKGWLVDWLFGRGMKDAHVRFFTWLVALALPLYVGSFFISNPILFLVAYAIVWTLIGSCLLFFAATIQLVTPRELRARIVAIFITLFAVIGGGVGPPLTGFLTEFVFRDNRSVGYSMAVIGFVTLPLAWILLRSVLSQVRASVEEYEMR